MSARHQEGPARWISRRVGGRRWLAAAAIAFSFVVPGHLSAETTLLRADLQSGQVSRIDQSARVDDGLGALDDALAGAIGSGSKSGFSTTWFDPIYSRLQAELRRVRLRAPASLLVFVYPGRITADGLRRLTEVRVDLELVIDPCERTVCTDAVATHIEVLGRALEATTIPPEGTKVTFSNVVIRAASDLHNDGGTEYQLSAKQCMTAGKTAGGGAACLRKLGQAEQNYGPLAAKAIAKQAIKRRVRLVGAPRVRRNDGEVEVELEIKCDRVRRKTQMLAALSAVAAGLAATAPPAASSAITLSMKPTDSAEAARRYTCPGNAAADYLKGTLAGQAFMDTYVTELVAHKNATTLAFNEGEANGGALAEGSHASTSAPPDESEAFAALSSHFDGLRTCVAAESRRHASFGGVTLRVRWSPNGRGQLAGLVEPGFKGSAFERCLGQAVATIPLPRFSGASQTFEFPILVQKR